MDYCGSASLSSVGLSTTASIAFESFRAVLISGPPFSAQHQVVIYTDGIPGFCLQTTDVLTGFYIQY